MNRLSSHSDCTSPCPVRAASALGRARGFCRRQCWVPPSVDIQLPLPPLKNAGSRVAEQAFPRRWQLHKPVAKPVSTPAPAPLGGYRLRYSGLNEVVSDSRQGLNCRQLITILNIAEQMQLLPMFRFIPRAAMEVLQSGNAAVGKPMKVSARAADCGVAVGLIPVNRQFRRRLHRAQSSTFRLLQEQQLGSVQLTRTLQQLQQLEASGDIQVLHRELYQGRVTAIDFHDCANSTQLLRARCEPSGDYSIWLVTADKTRSFEVLSSASGQLLVSDMDPVCLGVKRERWQESGLDRPTISVSRLSCESGSEISPDFLKGMDPELGNITPRAKELYQRINDALGLKLIRHGPEAYNPKARARNLTPCLVFNPGLLPRRPDFIVIDTLDELDRLFRDCAGQGIQLPAHPFWRSIRSRRGSLYEAAIRSSGLVTQAVDTDPPRIKGLGISSVARTARAIKPVAR